MSGRALVAGLGLIPSKDWSFAQLLPEELGFTSPAEPSAQRSPSVSLGLCFVAVVKQARLAVKPRG